MSNENKPSKADREEKAVEKDAGREVEVEVSSVRLLKDEDASA